MKKARLLTALLAASVVTVLAACSSGSGGGAEPSGSDTAAATGGETTSEGEAPAASGTITMWSRESGKGYVSKVVDAFNASQSDVTVELTIVPDADFVTKFGAAAATGDAPDITALDVSRMQYFSSVGALLDLTDRVATLPYYNDMAPSHLNLAEYQGANYGVPFSAEASVLYRNKDLFTAAGLDPDKPPTNYQEFIDDAKAIHALGADTYGFVFSGAAGGSNHFGSVPFIWASGGSLLSDDGTTAQFDTPEVADFLQFFKDLNDAGAIPPSAASDTGANALPAFLSGKVGMVTSGAFVVNQFIATDPGFDWDISLIPGKDGGTGSFAGGDELAIPSGSSNPDAAWEFIKFATDKDGQTILAEVGAVPTRADLLDEIYIPLDPRYEVLAHAMEIGTTPKTLFGTQLFSDNQGPLATLINSTVFGGVAIPDAQATAQAAGQQIIDSNS